ncbi:MAG: hypothetical protein ABMA64_03740 [Myxococcota bacterium]
MGPPAEPRPLLDDLRSTLVEQLERRPYTVVMVSAAAGYVLGGGVPWWAVRAVGAGLGRAVVTKVVSAAIER